jgi:hypothetical protein
MIDIDPRTEQRIVDRVFGQLRALLLAGAQGAHDADPEYFSTDQVEQKFGIRRATVSKWVRTRAIKGVSGKPCLVEAKDLRRFLQTRGVH